MVPYVRLALLSLLSLAICGILGILLLRLRMTPADRERRRRTKLNILGRRHDGMLMDVDGNILHYTYSVQGVDYNASQDISAMRDLVPADAALIIGPVTLKYLVRNPANSIVIAESWSGLRIRPQRPVPAQS